MADVDQDQPAELDNQSPAETPLIAGLHEGLWICPLGRSDFSRKQDLKRTLKLFLLTIRIH